MNSKFYCSGFIDSNKAFILMDTFIISIPEINGDPDFSLGGFFAGPNCSITGFLTEEGIKTNNALDILFMVYLCPF